MLAKVFQTQVSNKQHFSSLAFPGLKLFISSMQLLNWWYMYM